MLKQGGKKPAFFPSTVTTKKNTPKVGGVNVTVLVTKVASVESSTGKPAPMRITGIPLNSAQLIMKPKGVPGGQVFGNKKFQKKGGGGPKIVTTTSVTPAAPPPSANPLGFLPTEEAPVDPSLLMIHAFQNNIVFKMYNCPPEETWVIGGIYQLEAVMMEKWDRMVDDLDAEGNKLGTQTRKIDYSPDVTGNITPVCRTGLPTFIERCPFQKRSFTMDDFYKPENAETFKCKWEDNHSLSMVLKAASQNPESHLGEWFYSQPCGTVYARLPDPSTCGYEYLYNQAPAGTLPEQALCGLGSSMMKIWVNQRAEDPVAEMDIKALVSCRLYRPSIAATGLLEDWGFLGPRITPHLSGHLTGTVCRELSKNFFEADPQFFSNGGGVMMYCTLTPDMRATVESAVSPLTPVLRCGITLSAKRAIAFLKAVRPADTVREPNNPYQWATAINLCRYTNPLRYDSLDDDQLFKFYLITNHTWSGMVLKAVETMNDDEFQAWVIDPTNAQDYTFAVFVAFNDGVENGPVLLETAMREGRRSLPKPAVVQPTTEPAKKPRIESHEELSEDEEEEE